TAEARAMVDAVGADGELRRLLEIRVPELIEYQDAAYARSYVEFVTRVRDAERAAVPGTTALSEAVARYLFKLMGYKDEYEVAPLHPKTSLRAALQAESPDGVTVHYNLHPPLLRALGWQGKLKFGRWFDGAFRALHAMRGLRGSALDPFGWPEVRRVERAPGGGYRALLAKAGAGPRRASPRPPAEPAARPPPVPAD